jgi:tetratricopeptide (TPR) repeat protein
MAATYDVFVSHAWADGDRPGQIANALRESGLRVWFDETEVGDFASITRAVIEGLAQSKVLLAYYSKTYPLRRACQWELTAAFLAGQHEGDPRRRVLVVNPEQQVEHIHPIELRDAKFRAGPIENDRAMRDLVQSIIKHVAELDGPLAEIHPLTSPIWYGTNPVGSTGFVGRVAEMWAVHSLLNRGEVSQVTGAPAATGGIGQVSGLPGVGKSLLAEEYALRFGAAYPGGIFWLRALGNDDSKAALGLQERETMRMEQVHGIAERLGVDVKGLKSTQIEGALARELERRAKRCLWIVDDLPDDLDPESFRKWLAPNPVASTLVTTRTRKYDALAQRVHLSVLDPDQSYRLLTSRRVPANSAEQAQAVSLCEDLGFHPLALDVTSSAVVSYGDAEPYRDFRGELQNPDEDSLELAKDLSDLLPSGHSASIAQTMLNSIRNLDEEGKDFLRLASGLAVAPIPASLVIAVFEAVDHIGQEAAKRRQRIAFHSATTASLSEIAGKNETARAVHTLVSRTMRFYDGSVPGRAAALRASAVTGIDSEIFSAAEDPRLHGNLALLVPHARLLVQTPITEDETRLLNNLAGYDYSRGDLRSARALYERVVHVVSGVLVLEEFAGLSLVNGLGVVLDELGELKAARELKGAALALYRSALGPEDPETLTALNNLAITVEKLGDRECARKLHKEALELRRRVLGDDHPDTLTSLHNFSLLVRNLGDLSEAQRLQEEVLAKQQELRGANHPKTLITLGQLGTTFRQKGDLDKAKELQKKALDGLREVLGNEHPSTLSAMTHLGETLRSRRDLAEAKKLQEEALELNLRLFGETNVHTLTAAWHLFQVVYESGDLPAARRILGQHLLWLTQRDPENLSEDERHIRKEVELCPFLLAITELRKRTEKQGQPINLNASETPQRVAKIGRNDPCPCGSKLKYKKCCGA